MDSTAMFTAIQTELAAIRAENKQLTKLVRKIKAKQDDPDGTKAEERSKNNGFKKPLDVTEALRTFLGLAEGEQISRSEVTKRVSAYVTSQNLKHPDSGKVIVLDDKLKVLLNAPEGEQITFLNIQKYLSPHYIKSATAAPPKEKKPKAAPVEAAAASSSQEPAATPVAKRPIVKKKAVNI